MSYKTPPHIIDEIRRATAEGEMRKSIAKRLGIGVKAVTLYAKDVPKPFDHRGLHTRTRYRPPSRGLTHIEDLEDF